MTRLWSRFFGLVAALPVMLSGAAFASTGDASAVVERAWNQVLQQGSLEAFATFAMTYPDSQYAPLAYAKLADTSVIARNVDATNSSASDEDSASDPGFVSSSMIVV